MEYRHNGLLATRLLAKVRISQRGCWLWTASRTPGGYAQFFDGVRILRAHRWSYEHFIGEIPVGLHIDHLCRVRHCVNPWHMEPVTKRENDRRGESPLAKNARKTHCPNGHLYTTENTYKCKLASGRSGRHCRRCGLDAMALRLALGRPSKVVDLHPNTISAKNKAKTHCPKGHVYDSANTNVNRIGHRKCRTCKREWQAAYNAARK